MDGTIRKWRSEKFLGDKSAEGLYGTGLISPVGLTSVTRYFTTQAVTDVAVHPAGSVVYGANDSLISFYKMAITVRPLHGLLRWLSVPAPLIELRYPLPPTGQDLVPCHGTVPVCLGHRAGGPLHRDRRAHDADARLPAFHHLLMEFRRKALLRAPPLIAPRIPLSYLTLGPSYTLSGHRFSLYRTL